MPGEPWKVPVARVFSQGETISIHLPSTPMPCHLCGSDLRGKTSRLVTPHKIEDGRIAYYVACESCP